MGGQNPRFRPKRTRRPQGLCAARFPGPHREFRAGIPLKDIPMGPVSRGSPGAARLPTRFQCAVCACTLIARNDPSRAHVEWPILLEPDAAKTRRFVRV